MTSNELVEWAKQATIAIEQQPNKLKGQAIEETRPIKATNLDWKLACTIMDELEIFLYLQNISFSCKTNDTIPDKPKEQEEFCDATKKTFDSIHQCRLLPGHTGYHLCSCGHGW